MTAAAIVVLSRVCFPGGCGGCGLRCCPQSVLLRAGVAACSCTQLFACAASQCVHLIVFGLALHCPHRGRYVMPVLSSVQCFSVHASGCVCCRSLACVRSKRAIGRHWTSICVQPVLMMSDKRACCKSGELVAGSNRCCCMQGQSASNEFYIVGCSGRVSS
jgi:hypothetical protein